MMNGWTNYGWTNYGWTCPKCGRTYSPITPICLYCSKEISEKEIEEYEKFGENRDKLNKKDILTEDNG